jgi:hypothetical protein
MSTPTLNPFIYGKPVPTGRFVGRQEQVRTLFSRLYNGESTAIIGEPHIGKSSLLGYVADENTRREWISQYFDHHIFVDFDCHLMSAEFSPLTFWQHILGQVQATISDAALIEQCALIAQNNYGSLTLERLFKMLARKQWRLVLLIDEFDAMLNHPNFGSAEFLGALRSFATRTDALVVITASRLSVSQMNRLSTRHNPHGSPFFNNMTEVKLPYLKAHESVALVENTLQRAGQDALFTDADRALVLSLAGHQPFLLQVAAASLFDAKTDAPQTDAAHTHARATALFEARTAAHFEDVAHTLEANSSDIIRDEDRLDQGQMRTQLCAAFSKEELGVLCFDLGVDYEELKDSGKSSMAMQLILFCQRRGLIKKLRETCKTQRPGQEW